MIKIETSVSAYDIETFFFSCIVVSPVWISINIFPTYAFSGGSLYRWIKSGPKVGKKPKKKLFLIVRALITKV